MRAAMGVCGYLLLGEDTPGDVLSALNSHTVWNRIPSRLLIP